MVQIEWTEEAENDLDDIMAKNPLNILIFFLYFQLEMFNPDYRIIVRVQRGNL